MERYRVLLAPEQGSEADSLATWLRRQGIAVSFVTQPETMGAVETLSATVAGSTALRALALIVREWLRANRSRISVRLENGRSFEVEGATDVNELIEFLREYTGDVSARSPEESTGV